MVMIFSEALAVDLSQINTTTSTIDHVIASDFRLSTGLWEATGRLTMSRDLSRDDRCATQQYGRPSFKRLMMMLLSLVDHLQHQQLKTFTQLLL